MCIEYDNDKYYLMNGWTTGKVVPLVIQNSLSTGALDDKSGKSGESGN